MSSATILADQMQRETVMLTRMIIQTGARSCTAKALTGLTEVKCRSIYKEIHGEPSPPGQTPSDETWFTKTPERVFAATVFLTMFKATLKAIPNRNEAFIHSFYHYWRINGSRSIKQPLLLNAERADNLRRRWSDDTTLNRTRSPHQMYACRKCRTPFLGQSGLAHNLCPICETEKK